MVAKVTDDHGWCGKLPDREGQIKHFEVGLARAELPAMDTAFNNRGT